MPEEKLIKDEEEAVFIERLRQALFELEEKNLNEDMSEIDPPEGMDERILAAIDAYFATRT